MPAVDAERSGSRLGAEFKSIKVLIVAVHTEVIERLKEIGRKTQLDCRFLELEAFSAVRAIFNKREKVFAVVDFGAGSTKVYVADNGVVRSSHTISFGSQDITLAISRSTGVSIAEAERLKLKGAIPGGGEGQGPTALLDSTVSYLTREATKIIKDYEKQNGVVVEDVVLTGGGVNVKGFAELFSKKVVAPTRIADPFSGLVAPAFLETLLKSIGPSYSVAIGAALRALGEAH
jgi:type IV pilus assembly protein PilM